MNSRRKFFGWLGAFLSAPFAPRVDAKVGTFGTYLGTIAETNPHVGDVVLYTLPGGINKGKQRPATIVEIGAEGMNLSVWLDAQNDHKEPPSPPVKKKMWGPDDGGIWREYDAPEWMSVKLDVCCYLTIPELARFVENVKYDASGAPGTWRERT